jgi:uncharacterized protein with beta-barrel porin domain
VKAGTLAVAGGSLATSTAVDLPAAGATLDLTRASDGTVTNLSGAEGSTVAAGRTLTVRATAATTFAGALNATDGITKTGPEILTLTGKHTTPNSTWTVQEGTLALTGSVQARQLAVRPTGTLRAGGTVEGPLDNAGTVEATATTVHGSYTQRPGAHLTGTRMTVTGAVTLAGTFAPNPAQGPGVIIDNQGPSRINGTFDGLPEGASVGPFHLTYQGGDGNDVALTANSGTTTPNSAVPPATTASSSGLLWWSAAAAALVLLIAVTFALRRVRRSANPGHD